MRRYIGIAVFLGLLVVILSFTNTGSALAQGALKPVMAFIINDSANPVPVTGTIGVSPGSSITIDNPTTSPVFVRDVDRVGAREIVSSSIPVSMGGGAGSCSAAIVVPDGKRLVIEHMSAILQLEVPNRGISIGLIHPGAANFFVTVPAIAQGVVTSIATSYNLGIASQQMHVYSDSDVRVCVGLSSASNETLRVAINGYLTDRE